jgi:hypothetical protein
MTKEQLSIYNSGDLVKKNKHGERLAGLVLEGINSYMVRVIWETGASSIEVDDELELIASSYERGRYLIEGKKNSNE